MELLFASGNENKLKEVRKFLANEDIKIPKQIGIGNFEVEENGETLKENALIKAKALYKILNKPVFADDTGLFVKALGQKPGVHSHRYAGEKATDLDNRRKLLRDLLGVDDRSAYFKTVIAYIDEDEKIYYFEGILEGKIAYEEKGDLNFGYDKIFIPKDFDKSLGQISLEVKNKISHRARAMDSFRKFLENR
ncbi:MAG: RdgB/HAM1 family non-canonical purine NTP pyrophosphatase [Anaerococcus sp.]|nr:RdgB/HAM1 family non-canonical purine NTP pyrophosphatase [Anaerococcus sp.]